MTCPSAATAFASPCRSAPDELHRQRKLLTGDDNLCTLLDAMPEFVMVLNGNRQILLGNRALTEFAASQGCDGFIGLRPGELLSCETAQAAVNGCGTGDECRHCGAVETILAALDGSQAAHECRIMRKVSDGVEALDLKVWGTPLSWKGGQFAIVVAADISHEKRRQVLERLFFHDLLNTAGAISTMTELLVSGYISFDESKHDLWETAQALVSEIRGQRELLAAESNELKPRFSLLDSRTLLESVARVHRNSDAGKLRQIVVDDDTASAWFLSDESLLTRVIGNLVKNALEASDHGETVTVGCRTDGATVAFWCHNPAVIPPDVRSQLFRRSFSTRGPGRGIGTYSVRLLTERYLQGRVSFASTPGEGTTFTVTYPVNPVADDAASNG